MAIKKKPATYDVRTPGTVDTARSTAFSRRVTSTCKGAVQNAKTN